MDQSDISGPNKNMAGVKVESCILKVEPWNKIMDHIRNVKEKEQSKMIATESWREGPTCQNR